jgi:hypothetical protein
MFRAALRLQWRGSVRRSAPWLFFSRRQAIDGHEQVKKWLSARKRAKSLALAAAMNEEKRKSINQETQNE